MAGPLPLTNLKLLLLPFSAFYNLESLCTFLANESKRKQDPIVHPSVVMMKVDLVWTALQL